MQCTLSAVTVLNGGCCGPQEDGDGHRWWWCVDCRAGMVDALKAQMDLPLDLVLWSIRSLVEGCLSKHQVLKVTVNFE